MELQPNVSPGLWVFRCGRVLAKAQEGIRETRCHHCVSAALQDLGNLLGTGVAVHRPGPCECGQLNREFGSLVQCRLGTSGLSDIK